MSTMGYLAYATYVLTFGVGVIFFLRYDLRKKFLPRRLLGIHVGLAVLTFIFFTSAMATFRLASTPPSSPSHDILNNFHRHQQLRKRYHSP